MNWFSRQGLGARSGLYITIFSFMTLAMASFAMLASSDLVQASDDGVVFFNDIDDLPVMPGLTEDTEAGMSFDRPDGRIVEAVAVGHVASADIHAFYRTSLPSLGWQRAEIESLSFRRSGERLTLSVEAREGGAVILRISLQPETKDQ